MVYFVGREVSMVILLPSAAVMPLSLLTAAVMIAWWFSLSGTLPPSPLWIVEPLKCTQNCPLKLLLVMSCWPCGSP